MNTALDVGIADAVAVIDEERCIGCALCLEACPIDAIVGAPKLMHTVISASCIGCQLCLAPCPVDCIAMRQTGPRDALAREAAVIEANRRHARRNVRLQRRRDEKSARAAAQREETAVRKKRETIAKAVERARERLALRN